MNTITHIVQIFLDIERPNRDIYNLDLPLDWVKKRIEFFNRFTLPSLLNQTFQDFRIFLICGNKHKAYTSNLKWNKRIELCYGKGKTGTITTDPGYPQPAMKIEEFETIDTDYIVITRVDSDDMLHKTAMEDVRSYTESILPVKERRCLIFRKYLIWDMVSGFIRPLHGKASPPFITHIFPKGIYQDYWKFAGQHFVNHRFMGGGESGTIELPTDKICAIKHEENISRIKKNKSLIILNKEEKDKLAQEQLHFIFNKQEMYEALRNFSVNKEDVEGYGVYKKHSIVRSIGEKIDIIFLTCNQSEMSIKSLDKLKKNTRQPFRLIWIDNGSHSLHYQRIRTKVSEFENKSFRFGVNRFYARAINQGITLSSAKYIVTLSNDVFVTDDWLTKLVSIMEKNPKIGLLSPLTDKIGSVAPNAKNAIARFKLPVDGGPLRQINRLEEKFGRCLTDVSMFCAIIRREVIEKIGMLDERFFILGNDDDYCDRVRLSGYMTGVCLNCFVYHQHGVTKNAVFSIKSPERAAIKRDHQALLREKRRERATMGILR